MTSKVVPALPERTAVISALQSGNLPQAIQAVRSLLRSDSHIHQLRFIRKSVESTPALPLTTIRVALLSSFMIDFVSDALVVNGFLDGLRVELYIAGFNQFRQEILNPESGLYQFNPNAVIVAVEAADWLPAPDGNGPAAAAAVLQEASSLVTAFRQHSNAPLLFHDFVSPIWPRLGIAENQLSDGPVAAVHRLNEGLYRLSKENPGVYAIPYAALVARFGALHWYDNRMAHLAKAPIAQTMLPHLAAEYQKFLRGFTGRSRKCLVLDLDNTLWGGVLGEEGPGGIALGPNYPGSAFVSFQRAILDLQNRGAILAIASKNNPADVEEVFANHPHMVLRKDSFAAAEIHWSPKHESILNIAKRLNIGLEHMVFVDDNPIEIAEVLSALPAITALELPRRPEEYVRTLLEPGWFDNPNTSAEDRRRGELYQNRDAAENLRRTASSIEDFYRSLQTEIVFSPIGPDTIARASQLTQKTNQFNATTYRYSDAEIGARAASREWICETALVRDRFGDNGIVGLMLARLADQELIIDTFLLSCRVIGRTIETAMLARLSQQASQKGIQFLRGTIRHTPKNGPVRDLFARHAFLKVAEDDAGESWLLDLQTSPIAYPEWITHA
jgi:FkbH-like protein